MRTLMIQGNPVPHYLIDTEGNIFNIDGHEMTQFETRNGYLRVKLSVGCKRGMYSVHRLVGYTYIDNPHNYPVINHIDADRKNNRVENLEWCTHQMNNLHTVKLHGKPTHCNKAVKQISKETGEVIQEFISAAEAEQVTKVARQNISKVLRGIREHAGGFFWEYA